MAHLSRSVYEKANGQYVHLKFEGAQQLSVMMGQPETMEHNGVPCTVLHAFIFKNGAVYTYRGHSILNPEITDFQYIGKIGDYLK